MFLRLAALFLWMAILFLCKKIRNLELQCLCTMVVIHPHMMFIYIYINENVANWIGILFFVTFRINLPKKLRQRDFLIIHLLLFPGVDLFRLWVSRAQPLDLSTARLPPCRLLWSQKWSQHFTPKSKNTLICYFYNLNIIKVMIFNLSSVRIQMLFNLWMLQKLKKVLSK